MAAQKPSEKVVSPLQAVSELSQMIQHAQDERFKLLRLMKGSRQDSPPLAVAPSGAKLTSSPGAELGDAQQRMRTADAWISRRLEEFRRAEKSIDSRLDKMTRIEESFNRLSAVLKVQLEEAKPTTEHVAAFRKQLQSTLDEFLGIARSQIDEATGALSGRLDHLNQSSQDVDQRLAHFKDQVGRTFESLKKYFVKTIEQGRSSANMMMDPFNQHITQQMETCQQRIAIAVEAAEHSLVQRLPDFEQDAEAAAERVHNVFRQRLAEARGQALSQFGSMDEDTRHKLAERLAEHEKSVDGILQATDVSLRQHVSNLAQDTESLADQAEKDLEVRIDQQEQRLQKVFAVAGARIAENAREYDQHVSQQLAQSEQVRRNLTVDIAEYQQVIDSSMETTQAAFDRGIRDMREQLGSLTAQARKDFDHQLEGQAARLRKSIGDVDNQLLKKVSQIEQKVQEHVNCSLNAQKNFENDAALHKLRVREIVADADQELTQHAELIEQKVTQQLAGAKEREKQLDILLARQQALAQQAMADIEHTLDQRASQLQDKLQQRLAQTQEGKKELVNQTAMEQSRAQQILAGAQQQFTQHLAQLEQQVQEHVAMQQDMQKAQDQQLADVKLQMSLTSEHAEKHIRQRLEQQKDHFEQICAGGEQEMSSYTEHFELKITRQLAQHKEALRTSGEKLDEEVRQLKTQTRKAMAAAIGELKNKSASIVVGARKAMDEQIGQLEDDLQGALEPTIRNNRQKMQALRYEAQSVFDTVQNALPQHVEALRSSSEVLLDAFDEELRQRIAQINPQASEAMETAKKMLNERMVQLRASAQASVQLNVDQLSEQIEVLQARVTGAVRDAQTLLGDQLIKLQNQADTMTGALERRLLQRIEQIAATGRSQLAQSIKQIDKADHQTDSALKNVAKEDDHQPGEVKLSDGHRLLTQMRDVAGRVVLGRKSSTAPDATESDPPKQSRKSA